MWFAISETGMGPVSKLKNTLLAALQPPGQR